MFNKVGANFEPLITPATIGIWGLIAAIVIWWIRGMPERHRVRVDGDNSLRGDLMRRVTELEGLLIAERRERQLERESCHQEMERLREQVAAITRQFITYQLAQARAIPLGTAPSEEMSSALNQLLAIIECKTLLEDEDDAAG